MSANRLTFLWKVRNRIYSSSLNTVVPSHLVFSVGEIGQYILSLFAKPKGLIFPNGFDASHCSPDFQIALCSQLYRLNVAPPSYPLPPYPHPFALTHPFPFPVRLSTHLHAPALGLLPLSPKQRPFTLTKLSNPKHPIISPAPIAHYPFPTTSSNCTPLPGLIFSSFENETITTIPDFYNQLLLFHLPFTPLRIIPTAMFRT